MSKALKNKVKLNDVVSVKDFGAVGDGSNARTEIETANDTLSGTTRLLFIPNGTYLSENTRIDKPQTFFGNGGELIANTNNTVGNLIIGDSATPAVQTGPVHLYNMSFRWTVPPVDDNRATINSENAQIGVFGGYWDSTATAVRLGHINTGTEATSDDSFVIGATGKGVYNFGVEHIGSGFGRVIGLGLHNNGVQVGLHGVRWSGFVANPKRGNVLVGSVIRDRGSNGLSIQANQTNCVAAGNVFDNNPYGVVVQSSTEIEGRHSLSGMTIKGATSDGANLNYLSGSYFQGVIDTPTEIGIRQQVSSNGNRIDAVVHGGKSAWRGAGVSHLVDLISNSHSEAGTVIQASNSHFRIVCRGTSLQQRVQIYGSGNIIEVVDPHTADPSIRFETGANNNILIANVAGNIRCAGDGNVLQVRCLSNVILTGNNNIVSGKALGLTNTGTNNVTTNLII